MRAHLIWSLSLVYLAANGSTGTLTAVRSEVPAVPSVSPRPDTTIDTTFYITNRSRHGGAFDRAAAQSLEFGFVISRFIEQAPKSLSDRLLEKLSSQITDTVRLTRDQFVAQLRAAGQHPLASTSGGGPVVYVHGYATSFGRGVSQAAEIAHRGRAPNPFVVFSWPAHKVFAVWPSVHALVSRGYRQDSASAAHSGSAFLDALNVVFAAAPSPSVTVIGHSMGAQIVAEALSAPSSVRDSLKAAPLYALVLFAADISAERFRDSLAAPLALVAERRVMYASAADRLLAISHLVNHGKRAGQVGAGGHPADFEYVDVTNGRLSSGGVRGFFDPHHAMRYAGSALYDFFEVLRGLPAGCRVTEGIADRATDGSWRLTRAAIPDSVSKCSVPPHGN